MKPAQRRIACASPAMAALFVALASAPACSAVNDDPPKSEGPALIAEALRHQAELAQDAAKLGAQQQALRAQMVELDARREALAREIDKTNGLLRRAIAAAGSDVTSAPIMALASARGRGVGPEGQSSQAPASAAAPAPEEVGERPTEKKQPPEIAVLSDKGGVLLAPGAVSIEPEIEYIRSDVSRAEIVGFTVLPGVLLGDIMVSDANRDTILGSLTGRVGIFDGLEAEVRVPYVYRNDTVALRPLQEGANSDVVVPSNGTGIGDVEAAIHVQLLRGNASRPFIVGHLRGRIPTGVSPFEVPHDPQTGAELDLPRGTGFWSVQPSISVIWPSDPAVLFASFSYQHSFKRNQGGNFGVIAPGDQFGASVGLGLSLNEKLSLSFSYDHSTVQRTKQNGERLFGTTTLQIGTLLIGTSYRLQSGDSWQFTLGTGVTQDAPDLRVGLRRAFRFR